MIASLGLDMPFPELISAARSEGVFSARALGALTKGIVVAADFGGGALAIALGIKGIVDTALSGGNAAAYAENISYTLSGAAWVGGAALSLAGSALATIAFVGSGVLAIVGLLIGFVKDPRDGGEVFADGFDSRWGSNLGLDLFKDDWRSWLQNFFYSTHVSPFAFATMGAGIPTGRLDGSVARSRPAAFGNFS